MYLLIGLNVFTFHNKVLSQINKYMINHIITTVLGCRRLDYSQKETNMSWNQPELFFKGTSKKKSSLLTSRSLFLALFLPYPRVKNKPPHTKDSFACLLIVCFIHLSIMQIFFAPAELHRPSRRWSQEWRRPLWSAACLELGSADRSSRARWWMPRVNRWRDAVAGRTSCCRSPAHQATETWWKVMCYTRR